MTTKRLLALALISSCLSFTAAYAVSFDSGAADRNYQVFVERNPFGLKPPPPPPTNAPAAAAPKDEILLTGITSIGGPRAYFMTKAPQGKTPEFFSLGPDDKKNGLEVLQIDSQGKSVRVLQGGAETVMTFASNGVKAPAPPATPGAPATVTPGATQPPGATVPGVNPAIPATPGAGRIRTIPNRNVRTPQMDGGMGGIPNAMPNAATAPARPDPNAGVQDVLMMELQKRTNPNMQFPPTPLPP